MKNLVLIGIAVVVALAALGLTGIAYAYAQTPTPPPFTPGSGYGQGGMMGTPGVQGGRGMRGGGMMGGGMGGFAQTGEYGPMHEEMVSDLAAALKMDVDDLNAELTAGKTMWQVAEAKGLTAEQFQAVMLDARKAALDKLVAAGTITQAQADFMLSRMQGGFGQGGANPNGCPGGMGGRGQRWNTQPAVPSTNG